MPSKFCNETIGNLGNPDDFPAFFEDLRETQESVLNKFKCPDTEMFQLVGGKVLSLAQEERAAYF